MLQFINGNLNVTRNTRKHFLLCFCVPVHYILRILYMDYNL